jgi:hypothetical protein
MTSDRDLSTPCWSVCNQVRWTGFLVYFKLDFYCLCSLQKSSSSKLIFTTWFFKNQVQINRGTVGWEFFWIPLMYHYTIVCWGESPISVLSKVRSSSSVYMAQGVHNYCTCTIITRGLYIFNPLFWSQKRFFKEVFFRKFCPYVWLVFKSGFWSRAGYSGACTILTPCWSALNFWNL